MTKLIISSGLAAAVFAAMTGAFRWTGLRRDILVGLAVVIAGLILAIRDVTPISIQQAGWSGLAVAAAAFLVAAGTVSEHRIGTFVAGVIAAGLLAPFAFAVWQPVAAVSLISCVLAAVVSSSLRVNRELATAKQIGEGLDNSDSSTRIPNPLPWRPERLLAASTTAGLASVAVQAMFSDMANPIDDQPEEICRLAAFTAAGAVLMGTALYLEVAFGQGTISGPLVVLATVCFALVAGQDAVIPACSLAAAMLVGPLVASSDHRRELMSRLSEESDP